MTHIALDKKSNFEYLEKEVGLQNFLPKNVIVNQVTFSLRCMDQPNKLKMYTNSNQIFKSYLILLWIC